LRAELLAQIATAQFDLDRAIGELTRAGENPGPLKEQLQTLAQMHRLAGSASPASLAAMQSLVVAAIDKSEALTDQARTSGAASSAQSSQLTAAHQAIADVSRDFYDRKLLDPYLKFSSAEDEEEYRKREKRNHDEMERELAKGTPEGTARAAEIMRTQLLDAKAHGADASPDFAPMLQRVEDAKAGLTQPTPGKASTQPDTAPSGNAAGQSAQDAALADALATLKAAGVTTADIGSRSVPHGLPDSARPVRGQGSDVRVV